MPHEDPTPILDADIHPISAHLPLNPPTHIPITTTHCPCQFQKLDLEFKLQIQSQISDSLTSQTATPLHTTYHLLLKMPTRILDFISDLSPLEHQSIPTQLQLTTKERWDVNGLISKRHKLNSYKTSKSKIDILDCGPAEFSISGPPSIKIFQMHGQQLTTQLTLTQQGNTDLWTLDIADKPSDKNNAQSTPQPKHPTPMSPISQTHIQTIAITEYELDSKSEKSTRKSRK